MQLKSSGQLNKGTAVKAFSVAAASLWLASGFLALMVSAFGLLWSPSRFFDGGLRQGFLSVCSGIAGQLGRTDYIILPSYEGGLLEDGTPAPQGLFLTCLLVLLALIAALMILSRIRWLMILWILPVAAMFCFTEAMPGLWSGLLFGTGILCAFAVCGRAGISPWLAVLPMIAVIAGAGIGSIILQAEAPISPGWQQKASRSIENILESRYGKNPLPSGDLDKLSADTLTKERGTLKSSVSSMTEEEGGDLTDTALIVSMDQPDAYYLRGFIGELYEGDRWTNLSNAGVYDERKELYWLNQQGFDGLSQLHEAALAASGGEIRRIADETVPYADNRLRIQTKKANRKLVYVPYEMRGSNELIPEGTENYAGGYLKSSRLMGTGEYTIDCATNMTGRWTDWVGRLFEAEPVRTEDYFISESHYNIWVYGQYIQVSKKLTDLLYTLAGPAGDISRDHAPYKETIESVTECLEHNFITVDDFDPAPEGQDFLEHFIKTGKGTDVHYASLATELFRYFGIPARYVEGYLLTPKDARKAAEEGSAEIKGSRCHAWTEIYIDGYGWVPIEVTPEYRGIMPEADLSRGLESVAYKTPEKPPQSEAQEVPGEEDSNGNLHILRWIILTGSLLLLLLLLWLLRSRIRRVIALRRRRKTFDDPDPKRGICAMYAYMMDEDIPLSDRAVQIGDLAAYSRSETDDFLRRVMRSEMEWGENEKKRLEKLKKDDRPSGPERIAAVWNRLRRGRTK